LTALLWSLAPLNHTIFFWISSSLSEGLGWQDRVGLWGVESEENDEPSPCLEEYL